MNRAGLIFSLFLATILVVPTGVQAQETDDRPAEATESSAVDQQTSVDRETFNYPAGTTSAVLNHRYADDRPRPIQFDYVERSSGRAR